MYKKLTLIIEILVTDRLPIHSSIVYSTGISNIFGYFIGMLIIYLGAAANSHERLSKLEVIGTVLPLILMINIGITSLLFFSSMVVDSLRGMKHVITKNILQDIAIISFSSIFFNLISMGSISIFFLNTYHFEATCIMFLSINLLSTFFLLVLSANYLTYKDNVS